MVIFSVANGMSVFDGKDLYLNGQHVHTFDGSFIETLFFMEPLYPHKPYETDLVQNPLPKECGKLYLSKEYTTTRFTITSNTHNDFILVQEKMMKFHNDRFTNAVNSSNTEYYRLITSSGNTDTKQFSTGVTHGAGGTQYLKFYENNN